MTLFWPGSKSASLSLWFIRICQKLCCSYQYYYIWINMFKKSQTTDVLVAGSVFMSSKCCCISKRYQYTVCLVLICKIAENSFMFAWTCSDRLRDWIILSHTFVFLTLHSPVELSIYTRMSTLMIFIRNCLDFREHWYFPPPKTANNKERPLVLQGTDIWQNMITHCTLVSPTICS